MDDEKKRVLQRHHQELRSDVRVRFILHALRPLLTEVEYSLVRDRKGNVDKVDELIGILLTKENRHFDTFCTALEENGYEYWAKRLREGTGEEVKEEPRRVAVFPDFQTAATVTCTKVYQETQGSMSHLLKAEGGKEPASKRVKKDEAVMENVELEDKNENRDEYEDEDMYKHGDLQSINGLLEEQENWEGSERMLHGSSSNSPSYEELGFYEPFPGYPFNPLFRSNMLEPDQGWYYPRTVPMFQSEEIDTDLEAGLEGKKQAYPEDETRQWKFIKGIYSQLRADCPIFGILVIGETGSGKSTLINNLLGREVASVGHAMDSETLIVTPHEVSVEGVPIVVYDTPGLDDTRGDEDEGKHLDIMQSILSRGKIHLVIYCLKLTENRMRRGLIRTFGEYNKIGVPWEQTVVSLTFADKEEDRFSVMQQQLKNVLVERVGVVPSTVERLKICPTAKHPNETLPTGRPWYVPFWLDVVEVLVPAALVRFLDIHKSNILVDNCPGLSSQPGLVNVKLAGEDRKRFESEVSRLSETSINSDQAGSSK